ncbi:hypothetical protein E3N88_35838 [Mikania micrantha]|uniref:Uncharacterized protein n=1 Tax=Mikania micrantha TaxID=192012 RepID=A0A5N6M2E7_9ASTR|nr:hypothetical protein E3N88_35838 [Mikania micrantha]
MSPITQEIRATAEIFTGNEVCKEKAKSLLREYCLPDGLLPVQDVEELGFVKETGFLWVKQKNEITHKFEKVGSQVSYATEITSYFEKYPTNDKITMKTPTGISKTFPKEAFMA